MDSIDSDTRDAARAFRPKTPPLAIAVLANVVLAALCLGVPYYRGHIRAEQSLRAFSRFAGCLFDARPQPDLGLGFPPDERDHFAAQVLRAAHDWPARCRAELHAVAPDEAVFLWPSVKQAGADARAAVALVERELSTLARQRQIDATARVPSRPLLAVSKLRAALTLFARSAGADATLDADAFRFDRPAPIALPARLPLMAGPNATLDVWAGLDGLQVTAMDSRGISWLRVEGGKIDRRRVKRSSLVRAAMRAEGGAPWFVWATAPERCKQVPDRCAHRATGIGRFDPDAAELPAPRWLSGHPAQRADRSLQTWLRNYADLLSLHGSDGSMEVRRFDVPGYDPATHSNEPREGDPPLAAIERFALPFSKPTSAVLLRAKILAYTAPDADGARAFLWQYDTGKTVAPLDLGRVAGEGAWVHACDTTEAIWLAFGTHDAFAITRYAMPQTLDPEAKPSMGVVQPATPIALGEPLHESDPARDRLRVWCDATHATAVAVTTDDALVAVRCDATRCETSPALAHDVASFDAKPAADGATLVAYAQRTRPQVVVGRLASGATQLDAVQTPAACWDPDGGMCGQPTLVVDSSRIVLCARDGTDLLAIETEDNGVHWKAMSGLHVSGPSPSEVNAPMRQHRLRKGLD